MLMTKRQPASVGEVLVEEFMKPMSLTQSVLAEAMGVQRKHVNELCNDRRAITASTALILARVFSNSPEFWLNLQQRNDLWQVLNSPTARVRVERATPLSASEAHRQSLAIATGDGETADQAFVDAISIDMSADDVPATRK